MTTALVTGSTGLLGTHVVRRLLDDGWAVRGLVRGPVRCPGMEALGATAVPGDIMDAPSLARATRGCDAVIHAAALVGSKGAAEAFHAANVQGTRLVVEAAARAGARLVHVSSTAVYGQARWASAPADESLGLPELPPDDRYGRSKQDAERVVWEAVRRGRVWATVVRPTVMYGPGDRQLAPRIGPLLLGGCFPLPGGGRTTLTLVHADSVADGIARALERDDARDEAFDLARDFDVTVADFVSLASEGLGRRVLTPAVPLWVSRGAFAGLGTGFRVLGRRDLAAHATGTFRMLTRDNPFSCARARRELAWSPRIRPEDGIPEAFRAWASDRGPRRAAPGRRS